MHADTEVADQKNNNQAVRPVIRMEPTPYDKGCSDSPSEEGLTSQLNVKQKKDCDLLLPNGECLYERSQTTKESSELCQTSSQKESNVGIAESSPFIADNELPLTSGNILGEENTTSVKGEQKHFTATENTKQEASRINFMRPDTKSMLPSATQEQFDDVPLEEKKIAEENMHETISVALVSDGTPLSSFNTQPDKNSNNSETVNTTKKKKKKKKWDIPITRPSVDVDTMCKLADSFTTDAAPTVSEVLLDEKTLNLLKYTWRVYNSGPTFAYEIAKRAGTKKTAEGVYATATIGDTLLCGPYLTLIFIAFFTAKKPQAFVDTLRDLKAFLKGEGGKDNPFIKKEHESVNGKTASSENEVSNISNCSNNSENAVSKINAVVSENDCELINGFDKEELIKQIDELMSAETSGKPLDAETEKKIKAIERMVEIIKDEERKLNKDSINDCTTEEPTLGCEVRNGNVGEALSGQPSANTVTTGSNDKVVDRDSNKPDETHSMQRVLEDYGRSFANTISGWKNYLFQSSNDTPTLDKVPNSVTARGTAFCADDSTTIAPADDANAKLPKNEQSKTRTETEQKTIIDSSAKAGMLSSDEDSATPKEEESKGWWGQTISRWVGYVKEKVDEMERQNELDRLRYDTMEGSIEDEELDENEYEEGTFPDEKHVNSLA